MSCPSKIRITKQFSFEAAHLLSGHDGSCKNIHGHSYLLYVTIRGVPAVASNDPKCGMVMDFKELKKLINSLIINKFDHYLLVNKHSNQYKTGKISKLVPNGVMELEYEPTCENMVMDFASKIKKNLPKNVDLVSVKLYETSSSHAEWHSDDNKEEC